ncbi:MAG: nucleotidyl transferase AbiEii/AbiGii toxin family protein, partial [Candidatus Firestonebacteria bacterium]
DNLQIREVFHIEFLRLLSLKLRPNFYALKGGVNMRLFFNNIRYSEDMDIDVNTVKVAALRDIVMKILDSQALLNEIKPFGIEKIILPNIAKAKQTETTQRFKIHILASRGEDLFTKIEFSRRDTLGKSVVESVSEKILRGYMISPLIVSHYDIQSAALQKIYALAGRSIVQARDIFDLYILSTRLPEGLGKIKAPAAVKDAACNNTFSVSFHQYRDTVLNYLTEEARVSYENPDLWDEIKIKITEFICPKQ